MDLSIYNVIQGPVVTEKAYKLREQGKIVLKVHPQANKPMIKQAMKTLFNVEVKDINVMIRKGKARRAGRTRIVHGSLVKKAVITLAEGYSVDALDQASAGVVTPQEA